MRIALLLFLAGVLPGLAHAQTRAAQPQFKGVELYSWVDPVDRQPRFVLLPGTNRRKRSQEVLAAPDVARSVEQLQQQLARLAPAEQVFWMTSEPISHALPAPDTLDAIVAYAASLDIVLHRPGPAPAR